MPSKKDNIFFRSTLCGIISLLTASGLQAQSTVQQRSPIVVSIIVEGLSDEYLSLLEPQFVDGGFKRLMHFGTAFSNVDFGPGTDPAAATAILYTGAAPIVNGIPAATYYDTETKLARPILYDPSKMGNFTDETYSPVAINVSTLSDELKKDTDGDAYIYSIAPSSQQAIIAAGHAANGAFWLNTHTGNWATTTYYRDMPQAVNDRNYRNPLSTRLDTMKWAPMLPMTSYPLLSRSDRSRPFRYNFPKKEFNRYRIFSKSPLGNTELTSLAVDILQSSLMGKDEAPDMLCLAYSVNPINASPFGCDRAEILDSYLRLDRDLARLFATLDRTAGIGRTTIFLSGIPSDGQPRSDEAQWGIPTGEFSVKRAKSLLDMYLMAVHGNGDWVTGYHNKHFYLNHKLIKERNLNLAEFRAEVADFLARMSGISNVHTIDDIIASRAGDNPQATKRNTSLRHAGDVIIEVNPGWEISDDPTHPAHSGLESNSAVNIPAFIAGPNIPARRIDIPVDARAFAATIARTINIRAPNGAAFPAIRLK